MTALAFSSDGRLLSIGTATGAVILWELGHSSGGAGSAAGAPASASPSAKPTHRRIGWAQLAPPAPVSAMAFHPDGTLLHAGTAQGTLFAIDVPHGVARLATGLLRTMTATFSSRSGLRNAHANEDRRP